MRMAVNPIVDTRISNIFTQFHSISAIDVAVAKLFCRTELCRHMMGKHNFRFGLTLGNSMFHKLQATVMFVIEAICIEAMSLISDSIEIAHPLLCQINIVRLDIRPKSGNNDVNLSQVHHTIVIGVDVRANLLAITILHGGKIVIAIKVVIAKANNHLLIMI